MSEIIDRASNYIDENTIDWPGAGSAADAIVSKVVYEKDVFKVTAPEREHSDSVWFIPEYGSMDKDWEWDPDNPEVPNGPTVPSDFTHPEGGWISFQTPIEEIRADGLFSMSDGVRGQIQASFWDEERDIMVETGTEDPMGELPERLCVLMLRAKGYEVQE